MLFKNDSKWDMRLDIDCIKNDADNLIIIHNVIAHFA